MFWHFKPIFCIFTSAYYILPCKLRTRPHSYLQPHWLPGLFQNYHRILSFYGKRPLLPLAPWPSYPVCPSCKPLSRAYCTKTWSILRCAWVCLNSIHHLAISGETRSSELSSSWAFIFLWFSMSRPGQPLLNKLPKNQGIWWWEQQYAIPTSRLAISQQIGGLLQRIWLLCQWQVEQGLICTIFRFSF